MLFPVSLERKCFRKHNFVDLLGCELAVNIHSQAYILNTETKHKVKPCTLSDLERALAKKSKENISLSNTDVLCLALLISI